MTPLRFAVIGTGFWSNYQICAWRELPGVELVAIYNRTRSKAEAIAEKFGIPNLYTDPEKLLKYESLDFVDIITSVETHLHFTKMAASYGVDVICQKPMASSLKEADDMLSCCRQYDVKLFIHENFRFQMPIRKLKQLLETGTVGKPFKATVSFKSAFPVFENQPFLVELDHFILTDVGSHVLDICRYLFGEVRSLACLTGRINPNIRGEDVATVLMCMQTGLQCIVELSYASILEKETFPQTLVLVEGELGSLHLTHDFELKLTTRTGTRSIDVSPVRYHWADPAYAVVHSSIVNCNADILKGLRGGNAETTGDDNFKTVRLVWACYESAESKHAVLL